MNQMTSFSISKIKTGTSDMRYYCKILLDLKSKINVYFGFRRKHPQGYVLKTHTYSIIPEHPPPLVQMPEEILYPVDFALMFPQILFSTWSGSLDIQIYVMHHKCRNADFLKMI